jgi:AcrR family transcriptional regulator
MNEKLAKSAISRKRVLDAAASVFQNYGYAGTTMRVVGDRAGLKAGSIYYHFASKEDLIGAVLDLAMQVVIDGVQDALDALPPEATLRERVEAAIHAHLTAIIGIGDYTLTTRRVFGQVPDAIRAQSLRLREAYAAMWHRLLTEGQRRGEVRADANLVLARLFVLGALNWTVEWFNPGGLSIDSVARSFASVLLDGLVADHVEAAAPKRRATAKKKSAVRNGRVGAA